MRQAHLRGLPVVSGSRAAERLSVGRRRFLPTGEWIQPSSPFLIGAANGEMIAVKRSVPNGGRKPTGAPQSKRKIAKRRRPITSVKPSIPPPGAELERTARVSKACAAC